MTPEFTDAAITFCFISLLFMLDQCILAQAAHARREIYVGTWLPEPVDTGGDPTLGAERGEALKLALLTRRRASISAAMFSAVSVKPIVRFNNLLSRDCALGLHGHEFPMVIPDQLHEFVRENGKPADQLPIVGFEAFSFGAIVKVTVHWGSSMCKRSQPVSEV